MIADTLTFFESRRGGIIAALGSLAPASSEAREPMDRIREFCGRGKMIRGCMVLLGAEAGGGARGVDAAMAAAALELFQAGLLAHDDIMDRDQTRRGAPTIHARYAAEIAAAGASDSLHAGEALGICIGDLCYFEAFAALSRALEGHPRCRGILALCASGLAEVALAQMTDVSWGAVGTEPSEDEILAMYRGKTARYSFSLPLAVGALAANSSSSNGADLVVPFTELGERLGILFQVRDDELGLFGDVASTGKGRGSDLREGKKTLFRARLLAAAPAAELPRLSALFGGGAEAGSEDIAYISGLADELGVTRSISDMSRKAEEEARSILRGLPEIGPECAAVFEGLVEYVTRRDR